MPRNKYLISLIEKLVGDQINHSLEARIFHVVTMIGAITTTVNMTVNFCIGLTFYGFVAMPLLALLSYGYYISRFHFKLERAIILFAIALNFVCGATYFATEGSGSVNLFIFILVIFLLSFIGSKKKFNLCVPLTILHVITLFALEYFNPDLVKPLYLTRESRLFDIAHTWLEMAGMIAFITMYIQNSYNEEKKLAQLRLLQLEEINETKNKLFSIVSHDLRAPLNTIESYLSLLNNVTLSLEEREIVEQKLLASTKQTSEMLQNILTWSKDQMLGITVSLSIINITEILQTTIDLKRTLAKEKDIELINEIDPDLQAIADTDMLQLIVRNLLNNAIKFSSPGGHIKLSSSLEKHRCIIKICDTGIGISRDKGFDLFAMNSGTSYGTNKEKGVGLGLMLAKNYIELQNGKIWYENNPVKGTTFYISLAR